MGKQLRADIVIGGKADSSFYALGKELQMLGSQMNTLSVPLIEFGKESTRTYVSYEDAMLDAQVAMRTQYKSTHELGKVMEQLDEAALKWASDSRFNTQDVAGAIANAAHAGWNLQQIMNGVPAAMDISLAGGMSLAEGLEYLVDISNAAGLGFEDLAALVDTWAYSANKSSTTIPEMGQAMQKMGATMQFVKGDMGTLTTMLAVLADNGAKGTEAGTLLRNSIIRLIAPTEKATDAMELLGLSGEELDEVLTGGNLREASKLLEEAGYSAYDAGGNLKPFLEIFQELDEATSAMSEKNRNLVLSAIFPTRTITGALALLEAASKGWDGLNESISESSEGYAQYAAETMESGTGGALRHLESVYNAMQTKTGDALSEEVKWGADALSGMIEKVNGMDDGAFNALVSGLEVVAGAGPALMLAGGAAKLIGMLAAKGPGGWAVLGATGLGAMAAAMHSLNEEEYAENFGELSLDAEKLGAYIDTLGNAFQGTQKKIQAHREEVGRAMEAYTAAGESLKSDLLTAMLTRDKLSASEISGLQDLGGQMREALVDAIRGNYSGAKDFALSLDDLTDTEDDALISDLTETLNLGFENAIATAQDLSKRLRDAMTSAFSDGMLSSSEISSIQSIMDEMNALAAEQAEKEIWMEQQELLRDAQSMGLEGMEALNARAEENRDKKWAAQERAFDELQWQIESKYAKGLISEDARNDQIAGLNRKRTEARYSHYAEYDNFLADLWSSAIGDSALGGLEDIAQRYMAGETDLMDDLNAFGAGTDYKALFRAVGSAVEGLGGYDDILARAAYYIQTGQTGAAYTLQKWATMYDLAKELNGSGGAVVSDLAGWDAAYPGMKEVPEIDQGAFEGQLGGVTISVDGDITELQADIQGQDAQTLTQFIEGDATKIHATIMDENGVVLVEKVYGDVEELEAGISQYNGKTVTVNVAYKAKGNPLGGAGFGAGSRAGDMNGWYADGGRATSASVFGEDGPEWAIPEEHTQRTAELLNAAARASGFTMPELLSGSGGKAGAKSGYTLVYSPTIVASNADGVEMKLREDKERLEKWLREKQLHDDVEVYA